VVPGAHRHFHLAGEWAIAAWRRKRGLRLRAVGPVRRGAQRWTQAWSGSGATALHVLVGAGAASAALAWLLPDQPAGVAIHVAGPGHRAGLSLRDSSRVWLSSGVDPATAAEANVIYVFGRLPHHLVFTCSPRAVVMFGCSWSPGCCSAVGVALRAVACLHRFAIGALSITSWDHVDLVLYRIRHWPQLLRFYWFACPTWLCRCRDHALPVVLRRWQSELFPGRAICGPSRARAPVVLGKCGGA